MVVASEETHMHTRSRVLNNSRTCFNVSDVDGGMAVLVSRTRTPVDLQLVHRAVRGRTAVRF